MSLKAIAAELGISVTTVSRALGGYDDVAEHTREQILACALQRGYRPNAQARKLKTGRSNTVGLVLPFHKHVLHDANFINTLSGLSQALAGQDRDLLLITDEFHHGGSALRNLLHSQKVDALIVAHCQPDNQDMAILLAGQLPVLFFGLQVDDAAWFNIDIAPALRDAVERLTAGGYRRIAFIGGDGAIPYHQQRLDGFLAAMRRHQLEPAGIQLCSIGRGAGFLAVQRLLAQAQTPDAIIVGSNVLGEGVATLLQREERLFNGRTALIVVDELKEGCLINGKVTAIVQPAPDKAAGHIAGMIARLVDGAAPASVQTCWPARLGDGDTAHPRI
ncbi:LacI family DNA-binding transcriptional regulator [Affinibrenneria salicis]|uniref:LacI family DNA-binding transcriptional regulator n=1 Tax=Affinibrenneria salicis TaxID=2590031 RepID=UPI00168BE3AF|nr:LacI family DNA-binding transcriptional regulator [Affinibrenneria salicis]